MTDGNSAKPMHSPEEMCAIIGELSVEDMQRLTLCAARLAKTLGGVEARDLLHGAFLAATVGDRHCPKDVNPIVFLCNAMRSELFNLRRKSKQTESATGQEQDLNTVVDDTPELLAERMDILKSFMEEMRQAFGNDERPMMVFEGRAAGMSRDDIRELVELDHVQYASLEKKIRRFMNKRLSGRAE